MDESGKPVPGARVNVYQGSYLRAGFRSGIVVPPDYQTETNAEGIARLLVSVKSGEKLGVSLEIAHEDRETATRDIDLGTTFPTRLPLEQFTLKKKSERRAGPTITVVVDVQNAEHEGIEGASVLIRDSSLGAASGQFPGVTGANGRASISVVYGSADSKETVGVTVSKNGYKSVTKGIPLRSDQVGKTVTADPVVLEKAAGGGANVTVTVVDKQTTQGVGGAKVILDGAGYYSDATNGAGNVTFLVPEIGTFAVRISQDYYEPATDSIRLLQGEKERALTVAIEPKLKKDTGSDIIEVTVLARDPTDEKSKPAPLPGANVKAGTIGADTDVSGHATLKGAFDERQEVSVEANGYKSQRRTVGLSKIMHYSAGTGRTTFTLDPDLTENSPIRLIVEVRGAGGEKEPIAGANVDFMLPPNRVVWSQETNANGERDFRSSDVRDVPIAELRKGLAINITNVTAKGYKEILNRSVPADLLQPSNEARRFTVQLEKDWTALSDALTALEGRVAAWNNERSAGPGKQAEAAFIEKALGARKRAEEVLKEINSARETFGIVVAPTFTAEWCRKAKPLQDEIRALEAEANQKAKELKRTLDEAASVATACSAAEDAEHIRESYRAAIKLLAEIGSKNKEAVKNREELQTLAKQALTLNDRLKDFDSKLPVISEQLKIAEENARTATEQYKQVGERRKNSAARQVALQAELAVLTVKYEPVTILMPRELRQRFNALEGALNTNNSVEQSAEPRAVPDSVASAPDAISRIQADAEKLMSYYRDVTCDVDTLAGTVEGLDTTLTNASFEVGLAADLPGKADACAAKIAAAADQVTVPDVSGLDDIGQMKIVAIQAGMVASLAAKATSVPAGARLFAGQDPPANSKAKRGDKLTIFLNQRVAEAKATPTPTPVVAASPKGTPTDELVVVPSLDPGSTVAEIKSALAGAGLVAAFNAKGGKPSKKDLEFKSTGGQEPAAGTKAKRGSTVTASIYQKYEDAVADAAPTAPPLGPGSSGTMPSLLGLTIDQATTRLTSNMRIGGDEVGDKPPTPEKAYTIYAQSPAANTKVAPDQEVVVTVKRYGSAQTSSPQPEQVSGNFEGSWGGTFLLSTKPEELVIKITRGPNGYVVAPGKYEPQTAHLENGNLVFAYERTVFRITYTCSLQGADELKPQAQITEQSGAVTEINEMGSWHRVK